MERLPPPRIDLLVYAPSQDPLLAVLQDLLEPSPRLRTLLVPALFAKLQALTKTPAELPKSYPDLLDLAKEIVLAWELEDRAKFLASHPRIGETKGLGERSAKEQGQTGPATRGEVLKRLAILNSLYEESFPGLRFVTFVNGRTRLEIVPEIQAILNLRLPAPSFSNPEPSLSSLRTRTNVYPMGSKAWRKELERGTDAVFDIARSRLVGMGVKL